MKLTKDFYCVPKGEIYPVVMKAGQECPPEYEAAARETGALDAAKPAKPAKAASVSEKDILE
jgi:hypothetical protein